MLTKLKKLALIGAATLAAGVSMSASATTLTLPPANYITVGTYGDFGVYSLSLLESCAADPLCQPQSGLPVMSGGG